MRFLIEVTGGAKADQVNLINDMLNDVHADDLTEEYHVDGLRLLVSYPS